MLPWSWAIAYRRFQQGAMIRFGHARAVGIGTVVRMTVNAVVLAIGFLLRDVPGIVVAAGAVAVGVTAEALYAGLRVRPVVHTQIRSAVAAAEPLTPRAFVTFYVPLALTSLITFFVSPIGSAAMARMPDPLASLAAWPVVNGLLFMLRSPGMAYTEAVVALLDDGPAFRRLRRFALGLALGTLLIATAVVATPLATVWLERVMALSSTLVDLSRQALRPAPVFPVLVVLISWYQGIVVHSKQTRGITEAVTLSLIVTSTLLGVGIALQRLPGLVVTVAGISVGALAQVGWLIYRSRPAVTGHLKAT